MKMKALMTGMKAALVAATLTIATFTLVFMAVWGGRLVGSGLPPEAASGHAQATNAEERIWLPAEVNGKPVKLALDTAAEGTVLFRQAATRLGLKVTEPSPSAVLGPGRVPAGRTETCTFSIFGATLQTEFRVIDLPAGVRTETEGLVGWANIKNNVLQFDSATHKISLSTPMPDKLRDWLKLSLRTNEDVLILEIPGQKTNLGSLLIDTGSERGVSLAPALWRGWTNSHPQRARTLEASVNPAVGLVIREEAWADEIDLGQLVLRQTPVREADFAEAIAAGEGFAASLGLPALDRLDLVVDGSNGVAYARSATISPRPYRHNRIGAVFAPEDLQRGQDLSTHVLPGTPAYEAGVRDGDILQKIDNLDVTQWRTNPAVMPLSRFFEQPAGTKITLKLKRGTEVVQAVVTLRNLLGPKGPSGGRTMQ